MVKMGKYKVWGKNFVCKLWEEKYPLILSLLITVILFIRISYNFCPPQNFGSILNAMITIDSILLGFLGVSLSILLSIKDRKVVEFLFKNPSREILKTYFRSPIISGFINLGLSMSLNFIEYFTNIFVKPALNISLCKLILVTWIFTALFFVLSSYRIINIVMHIVFKDPTATNERKPDKVLDANREKELKEKYRF